MNVAGQAHAFVERGAGLALAVEERVFQGDSDLGGDGEQEVGEFGAVVVGRADQQRAAFAGDGQREGVDPVSSKNRCVGWSGGCWSRVGSDRRRGGPVGWWRGGEAELLRLGRLEANEGGLDAGMAGEFGGADAQDFAGVQRLGDGAGHAHDDFQFAGAVGDALFQGAVEGLKLAGHGFELSGELLDFVAGPGGGRDRTEVAGGDASRGHRQVTQASGGTDGGEADEGGGQQGPRRAGESGRGGRVR